MGYVRQNVNLSNANLVNTATNQREPYKPCWNKYSTLNIDNSKQNLLDKVRSIPITDTDGIICNDVKCVSHQHKNDTDNYCNSILSAINESTQLYSSCI